MMRKMVLSAVHRRAKVLAVITVWLYSKLKVSLCVGVGCFGGQKLIGLKRVT